jgi:hypothetical protein
MNTNHSQQRSQATCFVCGRIHTSQPDSDGCTRFCSAYCRKAFDAGAPPASEKPKHRAKAPDCAEEVEPSIEVQDGQRSYRARYASAAYADQSLVGKLLRDQRQFDPFAITKWKVIAPIGGNPGYLPTTPMRMGTTGFWITCARCSAEFESKGLKHCEKCRTMPAGKQAATTLGVQTYARSKCRRCHANLPNPVESPWSAFCSRDCYTRFYRCHCLVCQEETEARSPKVGKDLNLCGRKCRTAYDRNRAKYQFLGGQSGGQSGGGYRDSQNAADDQSNAHSTRVPAGVQSTGPVNLVGRRNPWDGKLPRELAQTILEAEAGRPRKQPVRADIVPDERYPGMWRVGMPDGSLSDMLNLTRAQDLALAVVDEIPARPSTSAQEGGRKGLQEGRGHRDSQNAADRESYADSIRVPGGVESTRAGPVALPDLVIPPPAGLTGATGAAGRP